jgi:hypothetical protein
LNKLLLGGLIAVVALALVVGGTLAGGAIALRRATRAEAAVSATVQATRPVKPGQPTPTPELVSLPGQAKPRPGVAGTVLDVTGNEITIKSRQGPTGRIVIGPKTVIRRRGKAVAIEDVKPGAIVIAVGKPNAQQRTVQAAVVVVDPPLARLAQ